MKTIHLGFEIGTGKPIEVPLLHTVVTGQTQESGKTTTLEAMVSRAKLRAIAFVTKRHEGAFREGRSVLPYFRERTDWQFVASMLEATMKERFKYERPWIVQVCKGATTLAKVHANVKASMARTKSGRNHDVYLMLNEYLDIVIPQIQSVKWATKVDLKPGMNVMDLSAMATEVQSLVIGSVMDWIYENESDTVTIIPEAWEFLPQSRQSPVGLSAEQLIRKGAAGRNFVWLDSQDLAAVNKAIIKSVGLWVLGVQREVNEVKRVLNHTGGTPKPKPEQIMQLERGQFYACWRGHMKHTYVQPAWMANSEAEKIARDGCTNLPNPPKQLPRKPLPVAAPLVQDDTEMNDAQLEKLIEGFGRTVSAAVAKIPSMVAAEMMGTKQHEPNEALDVPEEKKSFEFELPSVDNMYEELKARLLKDPAVLKAMVKVPVLTVEYTEHEITTDGDLGYGAVAVLIVEGFFDSGANGYVVFKELKKRGKSLARPTAYVWCDKLVEMGFLLKEEGGKETVYTAIADMKKNIKRAKKSA